MKNEKNKIKQEKKDIMWINKKTLMWCKQREQFSIDEKTLLKPLIWLNYKI